ncbi:sce7726 family protein [Rhodococcus fascians]|nr:sce7726 family protein [Rhodococcus fascians]MBY3999293.1 sce7726 family protein [Rhodococcus fascians]MBY4003798.1 sce7726 family protein [Rhodococcus fascians]MBY4009776.1 sce7726 family protein [Rhodococcus fascians]MBY4018543.1 sce7726 family protein [Rhodococcus fascians]
MRDHDVREALYQELRIQHAAELVTTRFVDEFGVCGEVRVDVAVLNGSMSGYELKSASDNLRRLPKQIEYYSKVLDYAVLVVADNHLSAARELLPKWWGITRAVEKGQSVKLTVARKPKLNPSIDAKSLAILLWRDEALTLLSELGMDKGVRSKTRLQVCGRLAERVELAELRNLVREKLKQREGWRSVQLSG